DQGAARACNGASQQLHKHPRGTESHTAAKLLRPRTIGDLLSDDRVAYGDELMGEAPMQTLAMGSQLPLAGGLASPGGLIALAVFPSQAPLARLLDASHINRSAPDGSPGADAPSGAAVAGSSGHQGPSRRRTSPGVACPRGARWQWWRAQGPAQPY